ncbi:fumarylacetoacetate hydrolase family protein [Arthrobacter sp. NPDC080031]|uniref:fumarylacetoacetate hydrolase family protein n=1 Tax=Arthrobacter sp. NPDC080031 TaxID=3155918 RepID=UPI00344F5F91
MRIANLKGRAQIVADGQVFDLEGASGGQFGPDLQAVYGAWGEVRSWAASAQLDGGLPLETTRLDNPVPSPRQVIAVGLNYREHAEETGLAAPKDLPPIFTKFVSSLTGPEGVVELPPNGHTDWEIELGVVIGKPAHQIHQHDAWLHVAGLTAVQDLSERILQHIGPAPQFSLGKSYPNFTPVGPMVVSIDEFDDPDDLGLSCAINDETVQNSRTSDLIFPVPALISRLSAVLTLYPGDLILTGTPAGVGMGRKPQRWLQPGDVLTSRIENIGALTQRFTAATS